jgi:hypothetical protein
LHNRAGQFFLLFFVGIFSFSANGAFSNNT